VNHLLNNEENLLKLINAMPDIVIFKNSEGKWIQANEVAMHVFQLVNFDYIGKTDLELAQISDLYRDCLLHCNETDKQAWKQGYEVHYEEIIPQLNQSYRVFDVIKAPVYNNDGSRKGMIVIGRDISERKEAEDQIKYLAYHDDVTGLPNRYSFNLQVLQAIESAQLGHEQCAVIFLDLNRFKVVNDTFGHDAGDLLLKDAADE
jgi:PAS domain S-box-containing protein